MRGEFPTDVPHGYCHCGCGEKTTITPYNHTKYGWIKGEPRKYLQGHWTPFGKNNILSNRFNGDNPAEKKIGKNAANWKGGRCVIKSGNKKYVLIYIPGHARSRKDGYVLEHVVVVEKTMGLQLPKGAVVHHIDGNGENNEPDNLMVFKNNGEHMSFHKQLREVNENG